MFQDGPHVTTQRPSRLLRVDLRWPSPSRSPIGRIAPKTNPAVAARRRTFHGAPAHARRRRRPETALRITTGNKTGQRSPDLSMPTKGRRAASRPTATRADTVADADARRAAADERLFVRRHASHVRLIPYWQLHGLFDSLFRVLFNFPSLYLLTIGLVVIFSFRWSLPPA